MRQWARQTCCSSASHAPRVWDTLPQYERQPRSIQVERPLLRVPLKSAGGQLGPADLLRANRRRRLRAVAIGGHPAFWHGLRLIVEVDEVALLPREEGVDALAQAHPLKGHTTRAPHGCRLKAEAVAWARIARVGRRCQGDHALSSGGGCAR
eukprot:6183875-Pleurochrysis_carterae.AAC.1